MPRRRSRLGKLTTTLAGSAPTREARRVVAAFLRGEAARGACTGKGESRTCAISSDGRTLQVTGETVASRKGNRLEVCVPTTASMQRKGKRQRETEAAKDVRVAASMLLRRVAGVGVRTNAEGDRLLSARGRSSLYLPAACVQVQVPKRQVALVLSVNNASDAAKVRFKTDYPSRRQVDEMRKMLAAERRMAALFMARSRRREKRGPAHEYDYTSAPEDRGVPFDVEGLLEPAGEDYTLPAESWEGEGAADLPRDVANPTDPDAYARFVSEYLPRLRKGLKRDMARAWQAYILNPTDENRPGASMYVTEASEKKKRAARQVELEIAGEYGIVDPIHGFIDSDTARHAPRRSRRDPARRRGSGWVSEVVKEQLLKNRDYVAWEERYGRKSRGW